MKKLNLFNLVAAFALLSIVPLVNAQLGEDGTGSRNPGALQKHVVIDNGADYKVVSFNGVASTTLIATGRGVLTSIILNSTSDGGTLTTLAPVQLFDAASVTHVTLANPSLSSTSKIVPDQFLGPVNLLQPASLGGAFDAASQAGVRVVDFKHPVQFKKGVVAVWASDANHGSMGVYWKK